LNSRKDRKLKIDFSIEQSRFKMLFPADGSWPYKILMLFNSAFISFSETFKNSFCRLKIEIRKQ